MVAISLYRGKLHRTPDVPRHWLAPTPKISLKDFRNLLHRRSRALSRLQATTDPNPNVNSVEDVNFGDRLPPESDGPAVEDVPKDEGALKDNGVKPIDDEFAKLTYAEREENGEKGSKGGDDDDEIVVIPSGQLVAVDDAKAVVEVPENASNAVNGLHQEVKTDAPLQLQSELLKNNTLSDIEKRKKEVEDKLQILNARKHNLVQVLKQILSAEEELRRRSNVQGRPSISLQVDVGNESGSMSRQVTPRPGSEANCNADVEGADADDGSNINPHSRSFPRMSSVSPSPDSLHRRAPFATVSNPSRTPSGAGVVASSPSRFAPSSQQNNPTLSVTGTNYVASSPSPAASGGTSVFRDARLPSPWN